MAGRHVLDNDRSPVRLVLRHTRIQQVLDLMLEVGMDRQLHRTAVLGLHRRALTTGHDRAVGGDLEGLLARRTRQQLVKLRLHTRGALALRVHRADDGGRHVSVGVLALEDRLPLNAVDI